MTDEEAKLAAEGLLLIGRYFRQLGRDLSVLWPASNPPQLMGAVALVSVAGVVDGVGKATMMSEPTDKQAQETRQPPSRPNPFGNPNLQDLVEGTAKRHASDPNPLRELSQALGDISYDLDVALMDVERLRVENVALREVAQAVADFDDDDCSDGAYKCHWCDLVYYDTEHDDDCPVMKARALLTKP